MDQQNTSATSDAQRSDIGGYIEMKSSQNMSDRNDSTIDTKVSINTANIEKTGTSQEDKSENYSNKNENNDGNQNDPNEYISSKFETVAMVTDSNIETAPSPSNGGNNIGASTSALHGQQSPGAKYGTEQPNEPAESTVIGIPRVHYENEDPGSRPSTENTNESELGSPIMSWNTTWATNGTTQPETTGDNSANNLMPVNYLLQTQVQHQENRGKFKTRSIQRTQTPLRL